MKILPLGAELFYTRGRTDVWRHDEANGRLCAILWTIPITVGNLPVLPSSRKLKVAKYVGPVDGDFAWWWKQFQLPKGYVFLNKTQKTTSSLLRVTHSPFINICVESTVQNVLHWRAGVRTVLDFRIRQKVANFIITPRIRANLDGEPSENAEIPIIVFFWLKIGYTGSLQFGCYYFPYVPASIPSVHPKAITLYCTWSDNR